MYFRIIRILQKYHNNMVEHVILLRIVRNLRSVDKEVEDEVECARGRARHFMKGTKRVVHSLKGVCMGFDGCVVLCLCKFGNDGSAKRNC